MLKSIQNLVYKLEQGFSSSLCTNQILNAKTSDIYVCDSSSNKTQAMFFSQKRTICSDLNLQTAYI